MPEDELLLCPDCKHWFDVEMGGEPCPICVLVGRTDTDLPTEPTDPDTWELDDYGHAVKPESEGAT